MAVGEDIAIDFYKPGSAQDLARCLTEFLTDPEKQLAMAVQNFSTALRMTMPAIVQKYLRHFELHQRAKALRYVTRFRKLPSWMPSKAPLIRLMTRNSLGWTHRSAVRPHSTQQPTPERAQQDGLEPSALPNRNRDNSGELARSGTPVNGDGVSDRRNGALVRQSTTGTGNQPEPNHHTES
jgi:hypothetical protein